MFDLVGPILDVIKFIGSPAKKYLNYHRKFSKYVEDLKEAKEKLQAREADVRCKLDHQNQSIGKKPKQEVQNWLEKVEKKINRAEVVEGKARKGKYLFRSSLGKLADETTQEIEKVYNDGQFGDDLVVDDPSANKRELPAEELVGSTTPAKEIYEYLMGDEVRKIGVWGMGGIGKTTIVKNVYNKLMKETKFNNIIWATISQHFDILKLQKHIALQLEQNLSSDEDEVIRADKISKMLRKQGSYVLILDDVWKHFSLKDVGIPEPDKNNGCKLIITTRSQAVVRSMDCCRQVQVMRLSDNEALQLFTSKVDRDILPNPEIESTVKLIVKECSGLPLAIVTVAGSMKGISEPHKWKHALSELRGHVSNIQVSGDEVFGCLKFSYDNLKQQLQPCFLYCALYPEDCEIRKGDIIEYWLDEGLIQQMETRHEIHRHGHVILEALEESCLLERGRYVGYIKMHDLVRNMALRITKESPRFFVKAGLQLTKLSDEQLSNDIERVSFMVNKIKTIPSNLVSSKCLNKLTSLFLSNNSLEEILDSFFDHMPNLKILDLSRNDEIVSLPSSLSNLVNLKALLLSSCGSLATVPSLAKLVALRKLDLKGTSITEVPEGLEDSVDLRYLNLGDTGSLEQIPSGKFVKLVHLQHLELFPASLRVEEVMELNKLEVFVGNTDINGLRMYVSSKKLPNEYFIIVGQLDYSGFLRSSWDASLPFYSQVDNAREIAFVDVDVNVEDLISVPSDIQQLVLDKCRKVIRVDDIGGLEGATNLKECKVKGCDDLEYLFSSWCAPLKTLESVYLNGLPNLKNLVENSGLPPLGNFSSLKTITLFYVNGIKKLFSATSIVGDLCNLEDLEISFCDSMEEIIASEEEEKKFVLPKLMTLVLRSLKNLERICSRNVIIVCDSLQFIWIIRCAKLERIPLYFSSLDNTQPSIPPSLKKFMMEPYKEWWERVEWDVHPNVNVKDICGPIIKWNTNSIDEDTNSSDESQFACDTNSIGSDQIIDINLSWKEDRPDSS